MKYDAVLIGKQLSTLRRSVVSPTSGSVYSTLSVPYRNSILLYGPVNKYFVEMQSAVIVTLFGTGQYTYLLTHSLTHSKEQIPS